MILTLLLVLSILFLAIEFQKHFKIPSPISLIVLSYLFYYSFPNMVLFSEETFAELVLFLIPILITSDALQLKLDDLKKHGWSLVYLALVAVVLSIISGFIVANTLFVEYGLGVGAIIALFAMVLATDPVSVVSVFSSFKVPHKLKILAEGESLFNDATALIIFSFIALPMINGVEITGVDIVTVSLKVIFLSVVIGLLSGFLGVILMKMTQDDMSELVLIIFTGYLAFEIAEHYHLAGLLAVIVAIITLNHITEKSLKEADRRIRKSRRILDKTNRSRKIFSSRFMSGISNKLKNDITTVEKHKQNLNYIAVLALLANAFLFISMASIVNLDLLLKYQSEILWMFLVTTTIRALMMAKFAFISNKIQIMANIGKRWWGVLLFAGIKGGLSIVMLQMLPAGFEHKELFDAIVVGIILLSTITYALTLVVIITVNKKVFEEEYDAEHHR
ncbi:MAG TPA: sodium:proton antiporter [Campylobacterales bacterium]|nr:sodium:proton antiporter [Campylobacterales bacterium]